MGRGGKRSGDGGSGGKDATGEGEEVTKAETANTTTTDTEIGAATDMEALATNDESNPTQLG